MIISEKESKVGVLLGSMFIALLYHNSQYKIWITPAGGMTLSTLKCTLRGRPLNIKNCEKNISIQVPSIYSVTENVKIK